MRHRNRFNWFNNFSYDENTNGYNDPNKFEELDFIDSFEFDSETNTLSFHIKHKSMKPKITRYVTYNYNKTPIYEDVSIRYSSLVKFNKKIIPIRFMEEEILQMNKINDDLKVELVNKLNFCLSKTYIPSWLEKKKECDKYQNQITNINQEINQMSFWLQEQEADYKDKEEIVRRIKLKTKIRKDPTYRLVVGIITLPLIIGIAILCTYTSEKKAENNKRQISVLESEFEKIKNNFEKNHELVNKKIDDKNKSINSLLEKINEIKQTDYRVKVFDEDGFLDLRHEMNFSKKDIFKGVYIIWNKTKNLYYVGQSKNVNKRIFRDHFNNNDVKNIIFAKDWWNGDDFYYKTIECETKDELDSLEKELIEKYNSFVSGYNKTGGNV
ncbi:GIY-YIG nuclease family protein [Malacoplasma penetrans]|uniref:GIY-YIG nuclease family protein n=2 Tax=Malacoplasma penetrans TaxID=28227 RepID=UPI00197BAC25|nr:GIY-YIG nuclease family protein [Malacoplasma penetrans]